MKTPTVELSDCIMCGVCQEVCPEVFQVREDLGYVEITEMARYPEDQVDEAIKNCPADCIQWADQ